MSGSSHGSLGEEAARLAEAVQEWVHDAARSGGTSMGDGPGTECTGCPACRLLRVVRSAQPEVYAHLADAAASLSAALRELVRDSDGHDPPDGEQAPPARPAARRDRVERIDLG